MSFLQASSPPTYAQAQGRPHASNRHAARKHDGACTRVFASLHVSAKMPARESLRNSHVSAKELTRKFEGNSHVSSEVTYT